MSDLVLVVKNLNCEGRYTLYCVTEMLRQMMKKLRQIEVTACFWLLGYGSKAMVFVKLLVTW